MKSPRNHVMVETIGWASMPIGEEYLDDNRYDYIDSALALIKFVKLHAKELEQYVEYHHASESDNFFAVPIYHLSQLGATFDPKFVQYVRRFPEIRVDGNIVDFNLDNETVTLYI